MVRHLPGGVNHGTDLGLRTVTKQKYWKRRIRERMQRTGESYTTARLHLLEAVPATPEAVLLPKGKPARIRFRVRRMSRRTRRPLGLRYVAPAFGIVISLTIGVAGFLTATTPHSPDVNSTDVTEGRP